MATDNVIAELKRVISQEGRALLQQHNLLAPLVQQMVISEAIAASPLEADELDQAKLSLVKERGHQSLDQWPEVLKQLGHSEEWCSRR